MIIDYPKEIHIKKALNQKLPLISLLTTGVLNKRILANFAQRKRGSFNSHFNVITGLNAQKVFVNDPEVFEPSFEKSEKFGGYELGGPQSYLLEDYLFAIYANIGQDLDNGTLIIAKPK